MLDPEEIERCKDPLYVYNKYWRVNGSPVKPMTQQEWDTYLTTYRPRKGGHWAMWQAIVVSTILENGYYLLLCREEDDIRELMLVEKITAIIGKENLIITKKYYTPPVKRTYPWGFDDAEPGFLLEPQKPRFSGYAFELITKQ